MIHQPPELLDLISIDRRRREADAAAERLRGPGSLRVGAAAVLRGLADQLSPLPVPPRVATAPASHSVRPVRSRCHPVV